MTATTASTRVRLDELAALRESAAGLLARTWPGPGSRTDGVDLRAVVATAREHGWLDLRGPGEAGTEDDYDAAPALGDVTGAAGCPLPVYAGAQPGALEEGEFDHALRLSIMYVVGGGTNDVLRGLLARRPGLPR